MDLSKPHYGIHGTPEPQTIGRAESHGCVRLTNWDAARLAQMVSPGTQVLFERRDGRRRPQRTRGPPNGSGGGGRRAPRGSCA
ncbi:L,D-transpeptidase [Listeria monocytogenes]|uniref:L,D-transpeptidase n=1 Tax=Listeria monocytogenes TaxID=1639 RepID=UPI00240F660D|nr:L,D-transpeptidase [Listeria monocytogenes]